MFPRPVVFDLADWSLAKEAIEMSTDGPELRDLRTRVEWLERQNRWLRRAGLAVVAAVSAVLLMGQAAPSHTVTANKFVLMDNQGRTRALFDVDRLGTTLTFLDASGNKQIVLGASTDADGHPHGWLELGTDVLRRFIPMATPPGGMTLSDGALLMDGGESGSVFLAGPGPNGPKLELTDAKGYSIDVGVSGVVMPTTGETRKTSAASILMFGNDKNQRVLWQAPEP
jgi:hypothetical protein